MSAIESLRWTSPLALTALVVPIAVWIFPRTASASRAIATGTLALWRTVAERDARDGVRRRSRSPLALRLAIAALALGTLALAGPRLELAPASRTWRVYLDRRPAMYLLDHGVSRLERGVAAAQRWLARAKHAQDDVIWIASSGRGFASAHGADPPREWLRAPRIPRAAPDWIALDELDAVWITDRAPSFAPRRALLALSGGSEAPGPIDARGTTRFDWDGARIVEIPNGAPKRRVVIEGALADPLARMLAAWTSSRELSLDASADAPVALTIHARNADGAEPVVFGREGWRSRGKASSAAPSSDDDGPLETWLDARVGDERRALVTRAPGRVWCTLSRMDEPEGDPAAFAVSLAELFDACALPADGVVDLRDRLDAGPSEVREPRERDDAAASGGEPSTIRGASVRLDAWLALAALAVALAAAACAQFLRQRAPQSAVARPRSIG
jgi:hypothetical protein